MVAAIGFSVLIILLEIFVPYEKYAQILKWLSLVLFAYIITAFIIHPDWIAVAKSLAVPHIQFSKVFIFGMIAFFGTTITPYLFFWQASEEVEEGKLIDCSAADLKKPAKVRRRIVAMRNDVKSGMIFSSLVTMFIVLTAANVLFKHGITNVGTAQDAAMALKPLAGNYAYLLFAIGIIGMGIMAVPVLAGACAYALTEVMGWREGLNYKFQKAKAFYVIIAISVIVGMLLNFLGVNPITALYYAAWLNGVIALPLMIVIMVVGNDKRIMGRETHPSWVKFFGWFAVTGMGVGLIATILLTWGPWKQ
jgi:Mn2+/Fe2+ NRAMP family transporter